MKYLLASVLLQILVSLVFPSRSVSPEFQNSLKVISKRVLFGREISELLEERIRFEEKRLSKLNRLREVFLKYIFNEEKGPEEVANYQLHPVSSFIIISRLATALNEIKFIDEQDGETSSRPFNYKRLEGELELPTIDDLIDSGEALLRLQAFYELSIDDIVSGRLDLSKVGSNKGLKSHIKTQGLSMSGFDCFELGKVAYGNEDWSNSVRWFNKAVELVELEFAKTDAVEILEYLAFAAYKNGQIRYAADLTESWLVKDPHNKRALNNLEHYVEELLQEEEQDTIEMTNMSERVDRMSYAEMYSPGGIFQTNNYVLTDDEVVRNLCRGSSINYNQYTCSRSTLSVMMATLPEVRFETLNSEPRIIRIHNIITEHEASLIRSLALEKLERSTIQSKLGLVTSNFRIAKTAWLSSETHPVVKRVEERISKILNFDLTESEDLQVVNYGVGGFYGPHLDSARETFNDSDSAVTVNALKRNDRLATILIYLNSVTAGGSTVFPRLNLTVEPIELSAVVWFNLLDNGSSDWRTLHTGCPILLGTKWIATIWPREGANIFSRPCGLRQA